jgi:hypothetical protein
MNTKLIYSCTSVFAFLVLLSNFSYAQQVLSSSGATGQNSSGSISYTLGELVIDTKVNGATTITQGFHQTQLVVTAISEPSETGFSIAAFPNPTNDFVMLKIEKGEIQNLEFILIDAQARFLLKEKLTGSEQKVSFDQLNPGAYFIKILKNGMEIQTFKIVKTQR